jgi:uncharacterized membrane protein YvlD (DUF360 family)
MLKLYAIKFAINAAMLYGLTFFTGRRIKFTGLYPVLAVALFLAPINVFIREIHVALGVPDTLLYVFISSVVCNGVMLYALAGAINRFQVDNLRTAIGFAAIMGGISLFLNFFLADQIARLL